MIRTCEAVGCDEPAEPGEFFEALYMLCEGHARAREFLCVNPYYPHVLRIIRPHLDSQQKDEMSPDSRPRRPISEEKP